jgi:hypothetical protein
MVSTIAVIMTGGCNREAGGHDYDKVRCSIFFVRLGLSVWFVDHRGRVGRGSLFFQAFFLMSWFAAGKDKRCVRNWLTTELTSKLREKPKAGGGNLPK